MSLGNDIRNLTDSLQSGIVIVDADTTIKRWNAWMSRYSAIDAEHAIGSELTRIFPELVNSRLLFCVLQALELKFAALLSSAFHPTPLPLYANDLCRESGKRIRQMIHVVPLTMAERPHCLIQISDMTHHTTREKVLRQYAAQRIAEVSEATRKVIGRELHDDLGQLLTGLRFLADDLTHRLASDRHPAAGAAEKLTRLLKEAVNKTRILSHELYPVDSKGGDLGQDLKQLTSHVQSTYKIACNMEFSGIALVEPTEALHLYRIAQEAITNAIRHGKATRIDVKLLSQPHEILLWVADNGQGIDTTRATGSSQGLGLQIMRDRCALLGAKLVIDPLNPGTAVTVILTRN